MSIIIRHVEVGLRVIGVWPGCRSSVGFFLVIGWLLLSLTFQLWHATIVFGNLDALMGNLGATMAVSAATLKLIAFRTKGRNVTIVISEILTDWISEKRNPDSTVMSKHMKRASYLSKWLIGAYNGLIVTYLLNAIIAYTSANVEKRLYVLPARFPAFCSQSPMFEIVCIGQFVAAFLSTNSHAMIEGLLTTLVLHTGTKVHVFQREISKLSSIQVSSKSRQVSSEAMRVLIKKHLNFIEFVERIKDIYIYVSFVHVFTFTLLHVIVGYMFIDALESGDRSIKVFLYGLFTIRALLSTMIHCIAGEYLQNQSKRLFDELYNSLWYEFSVKDIKAMNFMIMKARKPMCLTTAKFNQLSLAYLTSVIRTSFSFLSLARAVR